MQQEDYLKRQIDQLGRALGKILADLLGSGSGGKSFDGMESANHALMGELGMDIKDLTIIPIEKFIQTLQENTKFSHDNLDKLAEIFFLLAEEHDMQGKDPKEKRNFYQRSLTIYNYLDNNSLTYSFVRHLRMEQIKSAL
jgi:hypothetical protein